MDILRRIVALPLAVALFATTTLADGGNSFAKVRYNGGTFQTKVDPKDWDNKLTITSETVTFRTCSGVR